MDQNNFHSDKSTLADILNYIINIVIYSPELIQTKSILSLITFRKYCWFHTIYVIILIKPEQEGC